MWEIQYVGLESAKLVDCLGEEERRRKMGMSSMTLKLPD